MSPRPVGYFKTRSRPVPDWIIPGWLKRGNTGFIIGQPKRACKSWLLLNLAWDLSEGKPVWSVIHTKHGAVFEPPRPMRVVYFSQEDTEDDVQDRTDILMGAGRLPNDRFWIVPKNLLLCLDEPKGLDAIQGELDAVVHEAGPIDLVMFDPMRRRAFVAGGEDGTLSVIAVRGAADVALVQTLPTQIGTRLGAVDVGSGRVYLPSAKFGPPKPPIPYPTVLPGSFEILVVSPTE